MSIAENRKAFHDYFIEERYEAGIALLGWEVKAIRGGRAQIGEGYVMVRNGEIFLIGAHISPLLAASTHITPDPTRTRKLLLRAEPGAAETRALRLPQGSRVADALAAAGLASAEKFGIFGRVVGPDTPLADGDRVEVYRPLLLDPKEARRRRAARKR